MRLPDLRPIHLLLLAMLLSFYLALAVMSVVAHDFDDFLGGSAAVLGLSLYLYFLTQNR